jgi:transposase
MPIANSAGGMFRYSGNGFSTVEVMTSVRRQRRTLAEKLSIVAEASQYGLSVSLFSRKHRIAPNHVFHWRKLMIEGGKETLGVDDLVVGAPEVKALENMR